MTATENTLPFSVLHLAMHDVEPTGTVSNNFGAEGNGPSLCIHDPDGNLVELKGPPGAPAPGMA